MKTVIAFPPAGTGAADVGQMAKALLATKGGKHGAAATYAVEGRFSDRVQRVLKSNILLKAAVGAATLNDGDFGEGLADWENASAAFFGSMASESIFFRLLAGGMRKIPLRTRAQVISTRATAFIRREGKAVPVSRLATTPGGLDPSMAAAIVVVTNELAQHLSAAASNLINAEMRLALANAVDTEFFALTMDTSTPSIASSGLGAEAMQTDLAALLDAVNTTGTGQLFWAMSPDVGNQASLIADGRGAMSPTGGELLNLPALVSDAIPAGTLRLLNAAAIGGNTEPILLSASNETSLEMDDEPSMDSDSPSESTVVSMFQTNSTALMVQVTFGAFRARVDAIAEVTDVAWFGTT